MTVTAGTVVTAGTGQGVPVRAERHRVDRAGVAGQGLPRVGRAGRHVPQPDGPVTAAALARVWPSGLNATESTEPVWPVRGCEAGPVGRHIAPVSLPALARVRPSGLNATDAQRRCGRSAGCRAARPGAGR